MMPQPTKSRPTSKECDAGSHHWPGAVANRPGIRPRRYPVSDGAPVEVVEGGPSIAGRLVALAAFVTIRPTLAIGSYASRLPWPWGLVDFASRVVRPAPGTVRTTIGLPNTTARLIRAVGAR
jgi:hypothetical protein